MNKVRTTIQKRPVIFSSIVMSICIITIVLCAIFESYSSIGLVVYVFCSIFIICAIPIIADQLFHYLEIDGEYLINHILFIKKKIKISNIKDVVLIDDFYIIYDKDGKKFGSLPSFDPLIGEFLFRFEKKGIVVR
ncbi:MAG: hypothetical protein PUC70_06425 [bacterium]|nr:hypothetical protein [bacterium]